MPVSTAFLAARIAIGPFSPIFVAISIAFAVAKSKSAQTWLTSPIWRAWAAVSLSPVKISSLARLTPISLGSRWVPPAPGMIARPVSGRPKRAYWVATRRSVQSASSQPPPNAGPSTTEIVGQGIYSSIVNVSLSFLTKSAPSSTVMPLRSLRSAPAQNIPGWALRKIIQLALACVCIAS